MKTEELDHLIHGCLEGGLSERDAARLSSLLEHSAEARGRYWATASVHGLLEHSLQQASLRVITGRETRGQLPVVRWFHWRPLASAAAGLAFGVFGASMVWAYAMPMANRTTERAISVLTEGFEDSRMMPPNRFPRQANEWSGDMSPPVVAEAGILPVEGARMMRLQTGPTRKLGYAWYIVDLADHPERAQVEGQYLEVTAAFNTPGEAQPQHYQIRLAAFSQEPGDVRRIWNHEPVLFDTVLQHVGRNVTTDADQRGWQTVQASMEIPPGTRSVVISLAAGAAADEPTPGTHYLDQVRARFVIAQASGE